MLLAVRQERKLFAVANRRSEDRYRNACQWLPGGSTRETVFYTPFPVTIVKGDGSYLWDCDGHRYLDCVGEYSAGLFGHDRELLQQILAEIERHTLVLSGPTEYEARLAELICTRFPSCDLVRFCNSGTEANLFAIGLARKITGRDAILVFDSAYHGGLLTYSGNPGPLNVPFDAVIAKFNDEAGTRSLIAGHRDRLAAILVEPMLGSGGCIPAEPKFLQMLRDEASKNQVVLIFDEVLTSRLSPGGLQELFDIWPDLTTFGKYMGGGFSFGAFGGKRELMSRLDPRTSGYLPHAGTFNNNIASMIGGCIGLGERLTPDANRQLNALGDQLRDRLNQIFSQQCVQMQVTGLGSIMNVHFTTKPLSVPAKLKSGNRLLLHELLHLFAMRHHVYMARRGLITLNLQMTDQDTESICAFIEAFIGQYKDFLVPRFTDATGSGGDTAQELGGGIG